MQIGWDSKTDSFFITDLTDAEAGALQGTIGDTFSFVKKGKIVLGFSPLGNEEYLKFLYNLQEGLFIAKRIKTQIMEEQNGC